MARSTDRLVPAFACGVVVCAFLWYVLSGFAEFVPPVMWLSGPAGLVATQVDPEGITFHVLGVSVNLIFVVGVVFLGLGLGRIGRALTAMALGIWMSAVPNLLSIPMSDAELLGRLEFAQLPGMYAASIVRAGDSHLWEVVFLVNALVFSLVLFGLMKFLQRKETSVADKLRSSATP